MVDASVAVKWLVDEPFSEEAASLLDGSVALVAPELVFVEAANALWAMRRRGGIGDGDFAEAITLLKSAPLAIPAPMRQLLPSAAHLAADLDHPVYDCVYLALALQEQCRVITADTRFHDVVRERAYLAEKIVHVRTLASREG